MPGRRLLSHDAGRRNGCDQLQRASNIELWTGYRHRCFEYVIGVFPCQLVSFFLPLLSVHPKVEKEQGWENVYIGPEGRSIPFGAPSLDTLVPLIYSEGVAKRGFPVWWMARLMAENPARIFGIYPRKGVIRSGSDADLLIWDPDVERTIREVDLLSRAGFTPYEGWQVKGMPWMTLLRGTGCQDAELVAGVRCRHLCRFVAERFGIVDALDDLFGLQSGREPDTDALHVVALRSHSKPARGR